MEAGSWDLSKIDHQELKESQATLVFGQMNEPPGARATVALSGLTVAESFRDGDEKSGGRDILFFVDNIFRFTQAGSEVSALLGRMPSAVGYQPTLATEMGMMQERITSTNRGSITSVQAIYVPADDLTDPAPATTFSHLDATTVLNRKISELGIYPAVDPLDSTSRILTAEVVGEEHYRTAQRVKELLQRYKELQDIIAILGMDELSEKDKLVVDRRHPGGSCHLLCRDHRIVSAFEIGQSNGYRCALANIRPGAGNPCRGPLERVWQSTLRGL